MSQVSQVNLKNKNSDHILTADERLKARLACLLFFYLFLVPQHEWLVCNENFPSGPVVNTRTTII